MHVHCNGSPVDKDSEASTSSNDLSPSSTMHLQDPSPPPVLIYDSLMDSMDKLESSSPLPEKYDPMVLEACLGHQRWNPGVWWGSGGKNSRFI